MKSCGITASVCAGSSVRRTSRLLTTPCSALAKLGGAIAAGTKPRARVKNVRRFIVVTNILDPSSMRGIKPRKIALTAEVGTALLERQSLRLYLWPIDLETT